MELAGEPATRAAQALTSCTTSTRRGEQVLPRPFALVIHRVGPMLVRLRRGSTPGDRGGVCWRTVPRAVWYRGSALILRLGSRRLRLRHLPTGARIDLVDSHGQRRRRDFGRVLASETRWHDEPDVEPLWRQPSLTEAEAAHTRRWAPTPCTPLRSALMLRAMALWGSTPAWSSCWDPCRGRVHVLCLRRGGGFQDVLVPPGDGHTAFRQEAPRRALRAQSAQPGQGDRAEQRE